MDRVVIDISEEFVDVLDPETLAGLVACKVRWEKDEKGGITIMTPGGDFNIYLRRQSKTPMAKCLEDLLKELRNKGYHRM